jgi:hypothetical protein
MAKTKTAKTKTSSPKKQAQQQIILQLNSALPGLKDTLGEKKFSARVKKAARILSAGIKAKKPKASKIPKQPTAQEG